MKIALATFAELPELNNDDRLLIPALQSYGVSALPFDWESGGSAEAFDAVVIRSCWNYCEKREAFLAWIKALEKSGIPTLNSSSVIEWNSNKAYLKELSAAGIACVPTLWGERSADPDELISTALEQPWSEFIIKPAVSNNARRTHRVLRSNLAQLAPKIAEILQDSTVMIQPFVQEVIESGEISFIFFGGKFSHAVLKRPAVGDFRVQFTHGGNHLPISVPPAWIEMAERAAHHKSDAVYCRVDMIPTSEALLLGELEMIEPYLHLQDFPHAADRFSEALIAAMKPKTSVAMPGRTHPSTLEDSQKFFARHQVLDDLYDELRMASRTFLGYPCNNLSGNSKYARFMDFLVNNVGDPFVTSNYRMNSLSLEREVLQWFGEVQGLPERDLWGYVTSGGTEGNVFGLYLARELYPEGKLYFSTESHYSVMKAARLLRLPYEIIPTQLNGEIDYQALRDSLCRQSGMPAILNVNWGTTMKGAVDDVVKVLAALSEAGVTRYYLHVDAALFGAMHPFLEEASWRGFELPIQSMAISGHKFIGCPIPCGVLLARSHLVKSIGRSIDYINSLDSTLSGSRNGLATIILWDKITSLGKEGFRDWARYCLELTQYALKQFSKIGWSAYANPNSNIIVIDRPNDDLIRHWQLATEGSISHLIVMPHVSKRMVDDFVAQIAQIAQSVEERPDLRQERSLM